MFVPDDFDVPSSLESSAFTLHPLAAEHNERDYDAWMSSIDHIKATPGFEGRSWPHPMTLDENARDIAQHAEDFRTRRGFTYTVLSEDRVIGCVYIYPLKGRDGASVRSWARVSHASLDVALHDVVRHWLDRVWPFEHIEYAERRST
jgi:hypothetical protein